ncbi:PIN domain nuclease [Microbacterium resistens]|uniref:type II toxin-antitoxin system VapC family toxin n=1 Tax=Microbacterium resistens TaxID=156977 RepID=UPI000834FC87|nr:PIN domain nuclease [Microbacterium resistens]MBW1638971.1 PIN domain nuclease [Microbacterium resistens]
MILVDSSVWIDYLRDAPVPVVDELEDLIRSGADIRITEPVIMELLAGSSRNGDAVESLVNGLPLLRTDSMVDFRAAGELFRASRRNGRPIRSLVDCLIAAIAIRHDAALLHKDRDFAFLAEISPLRLHPPVPPPD